MIEHYNNWFLPATVAITTTIVVGAAFGGYIYYQSGQTNAVIVKLQEEINALKLAEIDLRKAIVDPAVEYKGMNLINQNEILLNKITELTAFREQQLSKVSFWKIDAIFQHFKEGINDDGLVSIYQNIVLLQKKFKASDLHSYLLDKTGGNLIAPNPYTPIDVVKLQPHFEKVTPITGNLKNVLTTVADKAKDKISHTFDHAQDTFNYTTESQALAADLGNHLKTHIVTFLTTCDKTFLKVMKTFSTWSPDFPVDCTMIALEAPIQISEISNLLSQDGLAAGGIATFCHFSGEIGRAHV